MVKVLLLLGFSSFRLRLGFLFFQMLILFFGLFSLKYLCFFFFCFWAFGLNNTRLIFFPRLWKNFNQAHLGCISMTYSKLKNSRISTFSIFKSGPINLIEFLKSIFILKGFTNLPNG